MKKNAILAAGGLALFVFVLARIGWVPQMKAIWTGLARHPRPKLFATFDANGLLGDCAARGGSRSIYVVADGNPALGSRRRIHLSIWPRTLRADEDQAARK